MRSADYLEQISELGATSWKEEHSKLNSKPEDGFQLITDQKIQNRILTAALDMTDCFRVSLYLRAVGLELLLKGLYWEKLSKKPPMDTHKVSDIYETLKNFFDSTKFNPKEINQLLTKVDEILIWAGRYPEPKENKHTPNAKKNLARTPQGYYTEDLRLSFNLKLLKEFHSHIAQYTSFNESQPKKSKI